MRTKSYKLHLNSYFQTITKCCRILCEDKHQMENSRQGRKNRKHILQEKRKGYDTENQHLSNGKNYYKPPLTSTYFDKY